MGYGSSKKAQFVKMMRRKSHLKALGRIITGLQSRNKQTNTYSMGF